MMNFDSKVEFVNTVDRVLLVVLNIFGARTRAKGSVSFVTIHDRGKTYQGY
jgi:hypothetical protein